MVAMAALFARPAHADDASLTRAQQAFDQAQVDYLQGNYDAAADGFKQAYEARAFPQFLYNIGAAYLMSHQKRTVDKYPMNFRYLDLIQGTFPDARIIDMRRDRDDTLISCWFRNFQGNLPWSYHWDDLNAAYDRYLEEVEGRDVFRLRYERLVNFPESTLAEVLDYCGLEWNERCLRHNSDPTFHMYAYEDVRKPVTTERIGRAANYREFLKAERKLRALA